jgi:hypothetical protein
MTPIAVLPVIRADDGVWEAIVDVVRGSDDIEVRETLDDRRATIALVRVLGDERTLRVFIDDEAHGVVRYDDALPGE